MSEGRRGRGSYGKRKSYYSGVDQRKRKSKYVLDVGQKGFLCTCNFNEKQCVREAYNILNEYSESLEKNVPELPEQSPEEEEDVEAVLAKEVKALQEETSSGNMYRKFQVVETALKNCVFIRTTISDPVNLVVNILEDIQSKKQRKTRFLLRMLPMETTCKAHLKEMEEAFKPLVEKYFSTEGKTFSVLFRSRYNDSATRDEVIETFAGMVMNAHPNNRADLNNPQLAILVEIIKSICCIGVVPNFINFRKYNLYELASPAAKENAVGGDAESNENAREEVDEKQECVGEVLKENNPETKEELIDQERVSSGQISNENIPEIEVEMMDQKRLCDGELLDENGTEVVDENSEKAP